LNAYVSANKWPEHLVPLLPPSGNHGGLNEGMQHPSWTFEKVLENYCKMPPVRDLYLSGSSELLEKVQ
jgi:hypothetical protein